LGTRSTIPGIVEDTAEPAAELPMTDARVPIAALKRPQMSIYAKRKFQLQFQPICS
jgi:hypothetical protein